MRRQWEVMVDLLFYRDPKKAEEQFQTMVPWYQTVSGLLNSGCLMQLYLLVFLLWLELSGLLVKHLWPSKDGMLLLLHQWSGRCCYSRCSVWLEAAAPTPSGWE
ncbi:hypothetical protein GW17_00051016 [Ensete ventricosum]|nr:hypothetical protein GW17_00051016 [Ensete ventricosum]